MYATTASLIQSKISFHQYCSIMGGHAPLLEIYLASRACSALLFEKE